MPLTHLSSQLCSSLSIEDQLTSSDPWLIPQMVWQDQLVQSAQSSRVSLPLHCPRCSSRAQEVSEDSLTLELRRLNGTHIADTTDNWEACSAIQSTGSDYSLLPRDDVFKAIKQASKMDKLSGKSKPSPSSSPSSSSSSSSTRSSYDSASRYYGQSNKNYFNNRKFNNYSNNNNKSSLSTSSSSFGTSGQAGGTFETMKPSSTTRVFPLPAIPHPFTPHSDSRRIVRRFHRSVNITSLANRTIRALNILNISFSTLSPIDRQLDIVSSSASSKTENLRRHSRLLAHIYSCTRFYDRCHPDLSSV